MVIDIIAQPDSWKHSVQLWVFPLLHSYQSISAYRVLRSLTSVILSCVYGWPALDKGSPLVERVIRHGLELSNASSPGASLVDIMPILKYLPACIAPWKHKGQQWYEQQTKMFEGFKAEVAEKIVRKEL
jgi:hypothetical protein